MMTSYHIVFCLVLGLASHLPGVDGASSRRIRECQLTDDSLQQVQDIIESAIQSALNSFVLVQADPGGSGGNGQAPYDGASSSTFIRWGRKLCTTNSQLVYTGDVGGSLSTHAGAAVNPLCLHPLPEFDNTTVPSYKAYLYGAEYEYIPGLQNQDVPCAVCRVPMSTTIMIPGTMTCPQGWTSQYSGHLVAGDYRSTAASEYICLDGEPEVAHSGHANQVGKLLYYTVTRCGSLPCPPFKENKVVTCVVCSK